MHNDERLWYEEDGFCHGYLNGFLYRMVCTPEELEQVRQQECAELNRQVDADEAWMSFDQVMRLTPAKNNYGQFEPASPFEEDWDDEPRRRIIAYQMYLPVETTWYGVSKAYDALMEHRQSRRRDKILKERMKALGLDPRTEADPTTRRLRARALFQG